MKARVFIVTFLLTMFLCAEGQPSSQKSIAFSYSMNVLNPGTRVAATPGLQIFLNKRFSLLAEVTLPVTPWEGEELNGFRISTECKKYLEPQVINPAYISFQLSCTKRKIRAYNSFFHTKSEHIFYETTDIYSPVFVAAVKLGKELRITKNLFADLFAGIGIRHIRSEYFNTKPRQPALLEDLFMFDIFSRDWTYNYPITRPHLTAGIRVVYQFY